MDFLITRDAYGVPHVRAETASDVWAGMGYACAQDRLFQMDYDRRRACGRWAEIAGFPALGADVLARRLGLAAAAQLDIAVTSPQVRAAFEAYASGVNQAIADGALPLPARYPVEAWQAWHSVAAFLVRHVQMGQWQHKLANAVLLARAGADAFEQLETRPVAGSPVAVPPDGRLARPVADLLDEALGDVEGHIGFLAEVEPGSNAWAVSGRRTAHGGAVICNDSHRALDTPNVYWQCRVTCPDFDVTGATFPGLPGFPHFGSNGSVAWAITHGDADTQDLYLERFEGTRYLTPSGWAEAEVRHERIDVRGDSPVTVPVWATRHGPVVHGNPDAGLALVLKWTGTHRANRGFECLLPMLTARTAAELADAQDGWVDPVNNLVCADTQGQIAYQCRGELPVRSSDGARRLPVPGWDDACEWTGTVPFTSLPRAVDPEAGFVMTANNAITDADEPYISYTFSQPWRAERLRSLLAGNPALSVDELAGMQADTVSLQARGWGQLLARLGPFEDEVAETARALLAGWDGDLAAGSAAALLYACFLRALAEALYRPVLGAATWAWMASGVLAPTLSMIRRWLGNDTWEMLGGPVPPLEGQEADQRARRERVLAAVPGALADSWAAAVKAAGPDPRQWRWGDVHRAARVHPLAGAFPGAPMGGDADTVQASGYGWRPGSPFTVTTLSVYRQVVDLADPASASFVIPGGASGDPASAHFSDQLALWADHRRIGMQGSHAGELGDRRRRFPRRPGCTRCRSEYPLCVAVFWGRLIGAQSAPPGWVVGASAAVALLIVASPLLWRMTRIAITIVHESGHAAASLLSGRRLEGIRLHADTSGETVSRGRRNGPGIVITAVAGYVTPPLIGVGASALLAAHRVTLLLSLLLVLLAVTLIMVRNWYGVLAVLTTAGALVAVIWLADPALRAAFAYAVAWFLLFGGVRPVVELARTRTKAVRLPPGRRLGTGLRPRTGPGMSDADQLAWLTRVPAGVWVTLFALVAVGAVFLGARLLIPWPTHLAPLRSLSGK